jgi:hypothetical protein
MSRVLLLLVLCVVRVLLLLVRPLCDVNCSSDGRLIFVFGNLRLSHILSSACSFFCVMCVLTQL